MFATLLFTSLATLAYLIYRFAYKPYSVLKKIGVKGPQPKAFFGNGKELKELGFMKFVEKYSKVYGSVWGYYLGRKAVIVVSDVEMLKQVTVKDFDSFINRCVFGITNIRNTRPGLLMLKDESWRNSRQTLTPTFSAMKMKQMVPLLQISCNTLVKKMGELATAGNSADVWRIFGSFTMESILAAAFGRLVNIQEGEADQLTTAAASTFIALQEGGGMSRYTVFPVIDQLPFLLPLFRYLFSRSSVAKATLLLNNTAIELVKARRNEHNTDRKFKDFLQLMIEATDDSSQKKLSNDQIVGLARGFLLAGYETTSTALAYTAYLLALHPRVQERLYSEIDGIQEESMYEAVQKLEYLDMVIQETLRLYPPGYHTNRECMKTTVVGGITVPKGTIVEIPIYHIHRSPQYWDDPEKFDPGRFTAEEKAKRNPLCHIPFGFGPRNCIGFRFALMEAKMALIGILKKYKFVRTPETEVPLQLEAGITSAPKNGVYLKIVPRNDN